MKIKCFRFFATIIFLLSIAIYCYAQLSSAPARKPPPPRPSGPFNDQVHGAVSRDGLNFEFLPGPFFKKASVPDVLELTKDSKLGKAGTLLLYFVDFSRVTGPGTEGISVATSIDGINWSEAQQVIIEEKLNRGAAVDPSVVELPDGRIRMYFFGSDITSGDPASQPGEHKIYSAISSDGINFIVEEGIRFQMQEITDPEVIQVRSEWLMFLSRGRETLLARSEDGLNFILDKDFILQIGGVPGAVALPSGEVRIFACSPEGIVSAVFDPKSDKPLTQDKGARIPKDIDAIVADPSPILRKDGSYYLIYKKNIPGRELKLPVQSR